MISPRKILGGCKQLSYGCPYKLRSTLHRPRMVMREHLRGRPRRTRFGGFFAYRGFVHSSNQLVMISLRKISGGCKQLSYGCLYKLLWVSL